METILAEDSVSKKLIKKILNVAIFLFFVGIIFLIIRVVLATHHYNKYNNYYTISLSEILVSFYCFSDLLLVIIGCVFLFGALFFLFSYLIMRKMQITITDKRVCGKTYFGRSVDLPMDSVSAVGASWLKGIAVSTSSGKVSFLLMEHSKEIYELLRQLLIDRQEQKWKSQNGGTFTDNAEELKKYKELLDSGVITQEEFETKKKQLLNS